MLDGLGLAIVLSLILGYFVYNSSPDTQNIWLSAFFRNIFLKKAL